MFGLRRARWLGAILIAPVLAIAVATSGYLALRCSVTGVVMLDSCCPSVSGLESPEPPAAHATIGDPACCERIVIATAKVPATVSDRSSERPLLPSVWATPAAALDPFSPATRPLALRAARPPNVAPPHFILTHSFLI